MDEYVNLYPIHVRLNCIPCLRMKDIEATGSLRIVKDHHHTIELYFGWPKMGGNLALQVAYFCPHG
ncbi:CTP synthase [Gossypium arboreum]|uniref:CTP synthase n=1 Tax=Gossypium arboreum TaxID=29729 RepID=A0A0B0P4X9_GOSAR|nr:CTP synthase [Gossypium arboreum]